MSTSPTRQRLINAASQRFYRDGFREVGIDQILNDVGISKTAFYKHFQSKDDLMLAVMDEQDQWLREHFRSMVNKLGGSEPRARLLALFDAVDQIVRLDEFRGCFFVNVAMEFPLPHDPAHVAAAANKQAMQEIVMQLAREAGADCAEKLAKELMLLMEGAYVTRHVTGDEEAVSTARDAAAVLIDRRLASAS
ncbi:MAG: TetR/AcrR family transcriptional regulator [Phycisphaerales bacterium]|nr:TetR/AcrR family transcriptional regulator [Phycisphaerales bacterium]